MHNTTSRKLTIGRASEHFRLIASLLGVAVGTVSAQVSDAFQSGINWNATRIFGSATLEVANGSANYTLLARTESFSSLILRPAVGSYTQDWSVQVDIHMNAADGLVSGRDYLFAGLLVSKAGDAFDLTEEFASLNYFSADMVRKGPDGRPTPAQRNFFSSTHKRAGADFIEIPDVSNLTTDAALRISFDAATKVLTAYYDANGATGGYTWTVLNSVDTDATSTTWNMGAANTFVIRLNGDARAIVPAGAVSLDNFASVGLTPVQDQAVANVSIRTTLVAGDTLIAGFVIGGNQTRRVLVRAIGPGLSQFNVTGVNPDPQVSVFSGATRLAGNDNWGGGATLTSAFSSVGAFGLPADSRDAAVILALIPGAYTAQVTGVGAAAGVTLVEVYELP